MSKLRKWFDGAEKEPRKWDLFTIFCSVFPKVILCMTVFSFSMVEGLYLVPVLTVEIAGATGIGYDSNLIAAFVMLVMPSLFMLGLLLAGTLVFFRKWAAFLNRVFGRMKTRHIEKLSEKKQNKE